jgi:hypothetical protein
MDDIAAQRVGLGRHRRGGPAATAERLHPVGEDRRRAAGSVHRRNSKVLVQAAERCNPPPPLVPAINLLYALHRRRRCSEPAEAAVDGENLST